MEATLQERLRQLLGIDLPILLAPMGGAVGPELCAAVSNAGGLGLIALWFETADLADGIAKVRELTDRPFGVNFNNQFPQDRHLGEAIDAGLRIASFFWGLNVAQVARAKAAGMVVLQTISTAADARRAVDAGVDIVVAQGWEAGGHVYGNVATLPLVPAVVDAVPETPVVAAGGIADGRGLAAVMALGAAGAWIGTRFLLAEEASVTPEGRQMLIDAAEADTQFGRDNNANWRDSAVRWIGRQKEQWIPEYSPHPRQLAGQGVALARRLQPAADIVQEIWSEAKATAGALPDRLRDA